MTSQLSPAAQEVYHCGYTLTERTLSLILKDPFEPDDVASAMFIMVNERMGDGELPSLEYRMELPAGTKTETIARLESALTLLRELPEQGTLDAVAGHCGEDINQMEA